MNKKSLILIVVVECLLSIMLISFLGIAIEDFRSKTLCSDIYFVDEEGNKYEEGATVKVVFKDSISYQLRYVLEPGNISSKEVRFEVEDSRKDYVFVSPTGRVDFVKNPVRVRITVYALDGSGEYATIYLSTI